MLGKIFCPLVWRKKYSFHCVACYPGCSVHTWGIRQPLLLQCINKWRMGREWDCPGTKLSSVNVCTLPPQNRACWKSFMHLPRNTWKNERTWIGTALSGKLRITGIKELVRKMRLSLERRWKTCTSHNAQTPWPKSCPHWKLLKISVSQSDSACYQCRAKIKNIFLTAVGHFNRWV